MKNSTNQPQNTPSVPIPPPRVTGADFESVSYKLRQLVREMTPRDIAVVHWLMHRAAQTHEEANSVVVGGANGLLVLFGAHGFTVVSPEGPLPTELGSFWGSALVKARSQE